MTTVKSFQIGRDEHETATPAGRVVVVSSVSVTAEGLPLPPETTCRIGGALFRVVGEDGGRTVLMPLSAGAEVRVGQEVQYLPVRPAIACGPAMVGRIVDAAGRAVDGGPALRGERSAPLWPIESWLSGCRRRPHLLQTGLRVLDGLLPITAGQRVLLDEPAEAGGRELLRRLARGTSADVVVVALPGRSEAELAAWAERLDAEALSRLVTVYCGPGTPALSRLDVVAGGVAVSEYFRESGREVLLLVDGLETFLDALRVVTDVAGPGPAGKPSRMLDGLLGRLGPGGATDSSAVLLLRGEPGAELRQCFDGRVVLNPALAAHGHRPAVDVPASEVSPDGEAMRADHARAAELARRMLRLQDRAAEAIAGGRYVSGEEEELDHAIRCGAAVTRFVVQPDEEVSPFEETLAELDWLERQIVLMGRPTATRSASF